MRSEQEMRAEHKERRVAKRARLAAAKPDPGFVKKRAFDAKNLVGREEWDGFIARLDERLDHKSKALLMAHDKMDAPGLMTAESLRFVREVALVLSAEVKMLKWVAALPAQIIKEGQESAEPDDAA